MIRSGGGRAGESFTVDEDRMSIGRTPDAAVFLDDVTVSRNHALLVQRQDGHYIDDLGSLNGTYVNRRRIESHRLNDGDEIQIGKYKLSYLEKWMSVIVEGARRGQRAPRQLGDSRYSAPQALTIGAVAKMLSQEFDDISISKIHATSKTRRLLAPRRTAGGYRLYSQADVERLRAILRMQRDEFLPLRVIRPELAPGDFTGRRPSGRARSAAPRRSASP